VAREALQELSRCLTCCGKKENVLTDTTPKPDLRDALAAERTFLAWIRTGLALMGFGFVVARFGLFLQQLQVIEHTPSGASYGLSLWFGTALMVLGVLVQLLSAWHHLRLIRELQRGEAVPIRPSIQAVLIALFLALLGLAMASYLVSVHNSASLHSENSGEKTMSATTTRGITDKPSNHSVEQTVDRAKNILQSKGVTLFALIDHSGEANKVGMKMLPTKLLLFGNPKAGTPLMLAAPSIAIDLPLKLLIWEDAQRKVWVSYNSPAYLEGRHNLPASLLQNIAMVETLATEITK
jgi:uncharacterized protein (DUF302 family)/uncharacterized membrane protein YidH (DUF202 family)